MKSGLIVLAGPTASGKSAIAIQLAKQLNCTIVNGDSRQLYREMRIGTAMPSQEELHSAQHALFASHSIHQPLSAGEFAKQAKEIILSKIQEQQYCILVGGSGLYIKGLLEGFSTIPDIPLSFREELNLELDKQGLQSLQQELKYSDPEYFKIVDIDNPHRIIRALEVIRCTGKKFSELRNQKGEGLQAEWNAYYLQPERNLLYERINTRVQIMIQEGLEEEVKSLIQYQEIQALQTVGYSEWWPYFEGNRTKDEVISLIQQHSRNYAKRQLTWFKKQDQFKAIDPETAVKEIYSDLLK